MAEPEYTVEEIAAAKRCLEAYGGDLERWPADAQARWGSIAMSNTLEAARAKAVALDELLDAETKPIAPLSLKSRIEAAYKPPTEKKRGASLWGDLSSLSGWFKPLPAGAFASLTALGFAAGAVIETDAGLAPEYEAYAYLDDAGLGAFDDETETLWDAE